VTEPLLELRAVSKHFPIRKGLLSRKVGAVRAVDGVSLALMPAETLALVGESGCGKSTTARLAIRLMEPSSGSVHFEGRDVSGIGSRDLRALRRRAQIIFQDPYGSLNPRMTVEQLLAEPLTVHGVGDAASRRARVRELIELVDLAPYHLDRYPHEFSGGQRQRIGIARALSAGPSLIVCDEPVSALDVSIQAQIVNLLKDLQARLGLSYLFISHGLSVVRQISDRVAVMYLGQIVEVADTRTIYTDPRHPYTQALIAAAPDPDPGRRTTGARLGGDVPSPVNPPAGCRFHTRCSFVQERCRMEEPVLRDYAPGHRAACHFAETIPPFRRLTRLKPPHPRLSVYAQKRAEMSSLPSKASEAVS
jgi:oligopeptide transport system ATP-binding protein